MGGRSPTPAPCCPPWSRGGQERSLYCGTLPPVSPSPSFSSIFHSSCFLHKAGVSRDSSQMFSAAHHIAFLMKYSWSLSAFCHESLLQLPAMETLCEAAFLQSHSPGAPDPPPRLPLGTFTWLLLPLPPPAGSAGAGASSHLASQLAHHQGCSQGQRAGDAGVPTRPSPTPRQGPSTVGRGWRVDGHPGVGHGGISPNPCQNHPRRGRGGGLVCRHGPRAAAGSQPARSISDAVHYNPIRLFMQTIRFYVSVKSLNNLNQSKRPEIITGGSCGFLGGGQHTLPSSGHPAWLAQAASSPGISWGGSAPRAVWEMFCSSPALLPEGLSHPAGAASAGGAGALRRHVLQAPAWSRSWRGVWGSGSLCPQPPT